MKKSFLNKKNGFLLLNTINENVKITNYCSLSPNEMKRMEVISESSIHFLNQISFPNALANNLLLIFYRTNQGYALMPVSIPVIIENNHSILQFINLSRRNTVGLKARFGDNLGEIKFQEMFMPLKIYPKSHLVIDYYLQGKRWNTVEVEDVEEGRYYLHVITDNNSDPIFALKL